MGVPPPACCPPTTSPAKMQTGRVIRCIFCGRKDHKRMPLLPLTQKAFRKIGYHIVTFMPALGVLNSSLSTFPQLPVLGRTAGEKHFSKRSWTQLQRLRSPFQLPLVSRKIRKRSNTILVRYRNSRSPSLK